MVNISQIFSANVVRMVHDSSLVRIALQQQICISILMEEAFGIVL